MSDDSHRILQAIAAIAVFHDAGIVKAIKYLQGQGWTVNEAFSLFETYEDIRDQIKAGRIG